MAALSLRYSEVCDLLPLASANHLVSGKGGAGGWQEGTSADRHQAIQPPRTLPPNQLPYTPITTRLSFLLPPPAKASLDIADLEVTDLAPLSSCKALRSINLDYCRELVCVTPLAACTQLRSLSCFNCPALNAMAPLLEACPDLHVTY